MSEVKRYDLVGDMDGNCNLNEARMELSDDGVYVKHRDYEALQAKCAALAAENALIKSAIPEPRGIEVDNDNMDDVSLAEDFGFNHAIELMKRRIPKTPAADAFLDEVRAQGVEMLAKNHQSIVNALKGDSLFSDGEYLYAAIVSAAVYFAAELRKGGEQK